MAAKTLRNEARRIARAYMHARDVGDADSRRVGARKTQRLAVAPRFRPLSVLKRDTYRLACSIRTRVDLDTLCRAVILRDHKWDFSHRPRHPTPIDWTLRLVRGALLGKPPAVGEKNPVFLFDDTILSRTSIELNFAYRHQIDAQYVTMFIDELGGHGIISAKVGVYEYDFRDNEWVRGLQSRNHPFGELDPHQRREIWARYSSLVSEDDLENSDDVQARPSPSTPSNDEDWGI